jgi:hypothetical protein
VIFAVKTPPVQHEVMVAQFDKAATDKDPTGEHHDQTSGLVGRGESLRTARVDPKTRARRGRAIDLAVEAIARQATGDRPSTIPDTPPPQAAAERVDGRQDVM